MILHIPHSSRVIPDNVRDQIILSDRELDAELDHMTDAYTDELFHLEHAVQVIHPISRLIVDVERFPNDSDEPMAQKGMGMIYRRTSDGKRLRRDLTPDEIEYLKAEYYNPHHEAFEKAVSRSVAAHGGAIIVDCHSFPNTPLPCDDDHSTPRPDFCVGTDSFHTLSDLTDIVLRTMQRLNYEAWVNRPYTGTIVPLAYYRRDRRVMSIMIEVNRRLYMNEESTQKSAGFDRTRSDIQTLLDAIDEFFHSVG
jgi:N-formylglutamate amidohydrolase